MRLIRKGEENTEWWVSFGVAKPLCEHVSDLVSVGGALLWAVANTCPLQELEQ